MSSHSDKILAALCAAYDFFAANPGATIRDMSAALGIKVSTARGQAMRLIRWGNLRMEFGGHTVKGQELALFFAVPNKRPNTRQPRAEYITKNGGAVFEHKRVIKPAKQVGMAPDAFALPRAFFARQVEA